MIRRNISKVLNYNTFMNKIRYFVLLNPFEKNLRHVIVNFAQHYTRIFKFIL